MMLPSTFPNFPEHQLSSFFYEKIHPYKKNLDPAKDLFHTRRLHYALFPPSLLNLISFYL